MIQEDINFEKLKKHSGNLLKVHIYENRSINNCPHCQNKNYIKFGKYDGIQRYRCRECKKTFSKTTKSLYSYSKKQPEKWIQFIELFIQKKSLRTCSKILNINIKTAFLWRHKIMQFMKPYVMAESLEGKVFITKSIIKENFKGCRNIKIKDRKNICIVCAKDRRDSMVVLPICKQNFDKKNFDEIIYSRIKSTSYIVPDNDNYMMFIAKKHNKEVIINAKLECCIKYFRLALKRWLGGFRGVATKYLESYLSYYILFNVYKKFNSLDFTYTLCQLN